MNSMYMDGEYHAVIPLNWGDKSNSSAEDTELRLVRFTIDKHAVISLSAICCFNEWISQLQMMAIELSNYLINPLRPSEKNLAHIAKNFNLK